MSQRNFFFNSIGSFPGKVGKTYRFAYQLIGRIAIRR